MVRSSRRQTLLRTTLPAVEHVEPSEGAALDFSRRPADRRGRRIAEGRAPYRRRPVVAGAHPRDEPVVNNTITHC